MEFAGNYPTLWNKGGPILHNGPENDRASRWRILKWRMLTLWFDADNVGPVPPFKPVKEDFGIWSDIKRWLARRWLSQIHQKKTASDHV